MSRIERIEEQFARKDLDEFRVGDTLEVQVLIKEGEKERIQNFRGTVIRFRGGGMRSTFTVRRLVQGEGVERIFPLHAPAIKGVKVVRSGRVRRSRLYFLRDRTGKATRLREVMVEGRGSDAGSGDVNEPDAPEAGPGNAGAPSTGEAQGS